MKKHDNPYSRGDNLCVFHDEEFLCIGRGIPVKDYESRRCTGMPPDKYCKHGSFMKGKNSPEQCLYSYAREFGYILCYNEEAKSEAILTRAIEAI